MGASNQHRTMASTAVAPQLPPSLIAYEQMKEVPAERPRVLDEPRLRNELRIAHGYTLKVLVVQTDVVLLDTMERGQSPTNRAMRVD